VPVTNPAAVIGGPPIAFDFTDEADGPLPGLWEYLILSDDGAGAKTTSPDPAAPFSFRVLNGLAGWFFSRAPGLPMLAAPFDERGVVASPAGIVQGRNAEIAIAFKAPTLLLDPLADEFRFEVLLGMRANDQLTAFVGGRARALWAAGSGWTLPLAVEAVSAAGGPIAVLAAAALPPDLNTPLDLWHTVDFHELRIVLRGGTLAVSLDGVMLVTVSVPNAAGAKPVILLRVFNRRGLAIDPAAVVRGIGFRTLRDVEALGPPPEIVGDIDLENPTIPRIHLPLEDLVAKGLFKRSGGRSFVATQDVEIDEVIAFEQGDVVRAIEPYEGQLLTPVVVDLAHMRAERRAT
jgi:hypothetical protein